MAILKKSNITMLTKELKTKTIIFGTKVTLKNLKKDNDNIEKIYLSSDCPETTIRKLKKAKTKDIIIQTDLSKEELKEFCNKHFNISVITILKKKKKTKNKK